MESELGSYHPSVSFLYFIVMIGGTMFFMHPIFVGISLISSIVYATILNEEKALELFKIGMVSAIGIILVNALFTHRGMTVLFYLKGNPITVEALLYGVCSGGMILAIMLWFCSYNEVITSEKFLYIFGGILPSVALMVNMALRLMPKLINQTKVISRAQKSVGIDCKNGSLINRAKSCMRIVSILVTWALEDAVETTNSMRARGYGVKKRSRFSLFKIRRRDKIMLAVLIINVVILVLGYKSGVTSLEFYPQIEKIVFKINSIMTYTSFLLMGILPSILELTKGRR
ncbi:MAG: energy-coupling factor transporter transmembrane component T [Clostridium sp.]|uniref:energy-coupling factor transporter transmembrane component T n=1 Tax=Clostridium sp. TaxID=1506 RepID=UPI003F34FA4B